MTQAAVRTEEESGDVAATRDPSALRRDDRAGSELIDS
jgi:hypothetical protein